MHGASCCHTPGILSCTLVLLPSLSCILTSLLGGAHPFLPSLLGPRVCYHSINMKFDALRRFARQVLSRRCILRRCLHRLTPFHVNHCDAGVYFLAEGHYHFDPWMMYTQYPLDMRRSETIHLLWRSGLPFTQYKTGERFTKDRCTLASHLQHWQDRVKAGDIQLLCPSLSPFVWCHLRRACFQSQS